MFSSLTFLLVIDINIIILKIIAVELVKFTFLCMYCIDFHFFLPNNYIFADDLPTLCTPLLSRSSDQYFVNFYVFNVMHVCDVAVHFRINI